MEGWLNALVDAAECIRAHSLPTEPSLATLSPVDLPLLSLKCRRAVALGYAILNQPEQHAWVGDVFIAFEQDIGLVNYYALATSMRQGVAAAAMTGAYMHISGEFIAKRRRHAHTQLAFLLDAFPVLQRVDGCVGST